MATLEPCPGCKRHVKTDEASCPFCGAALSEAFGRLEPRLLPRTRLGRAALFAFGVGATTALTSCAKKHDDEDEQSDAGETSEDADQSEDDGTVQPVYGAPADDDGDGDGVEDAGQVPAGDDAGLSFPLYGAAPSD